MKKIKYLSLILAAVLLMQSVLLPVSAETEPAETEQVQATQATQATQTFRSTFAIRFIVSPFLIFCSRRISESAGRPVPAAGGRARW